MFATMALLVVGLLAAPALGAPGRLLDKSGDDGFPQTFVTGGQQKAKEFVLRVTATPNERVEVRYDVSCGRKGKGRFRIGVFEMGGRATRKLKTTIGKNDDCIANVLVSYDDADIEGKIGVRLFARKRKG